MYCISSTGSFGGGACVQHWASGQGRGRGRGVSDPAGHYLIYTGAVHTDDQREAGSCHPDQRGWQQTP